MIPVVGTSGKFAFFSRARFIRGITGLEPRRDEVIFERISLSWYSCETFAALVERSRDAGTTRIGRAEGFRTLRVREGGPVRRGRTARARRRQTAQRHPGAIPNLGNDKSWQ